MTVSVWRQIDCLFSPCLPPSFEQVLPASFAFFSISFQLVAACATAGTHWVDITGETIWVSEGNGKYLLIYLALCLSTPVCLFTFSRGLLPVLRRGASLRRVVCFCFGIRGFMASYPPSSLDPFTDSQALSCTIRSDPFVCRCPGLIVCLFQSLNPRSTHN